MKFELYQANSGFYRVLADGNTHPLLCGFCLASRSGVSKLRGRLAQVYPRHTFIFRRQSDDNGGRWLIVGAKIPPTDVDVRENDDGTCTGFDRADGEPLEHLKNLPNSSHVWRQMQIHYPTAFENALIAEKPSREEREARHRRLANHIAKLPEPIKLVEIVKTVLKFKGTYKFLNVVKHTDGLAHLEARRVGVQEAKNFDGPDDAATCMHDLVGSKIVADGELVIRRVRIAYEELQDNE